MKTAFDLRLESDRTAAGRALRPMISAFLDDGGRRHVPTGPAWEAFTAVVDGLRQRSLDRLQEGHTGALARLLEAFGMKSAQVVTSADFARLAGYQQALRDVVAEVQGLALQAVEADVKHEQSQQRRSERMRPAPGSSGI
jgi:hypothetical protein